MRPWLLDHFTLVFYLLHTPALKLNIYSQDLTQKHLPQLTFLSQKHEFLLLCSFQGAHRVNPAKDFLFSQAFSPIACPLLSPTRFGWLVEVSGLEPLTSALQRQRSTH